MPELPGAGKNAQLAEDEYAGVEIQPSEELLLIESIITGAGDMCADILPALFLLENCRNFADELRMEEYNDAYIVLAGLCREFSEETGGGLKPVGDYLDFFMD